MGHFYNLLIQAFAELRSAKDQPQTKREAKRQRHHIRLWLMHLVAAFILLLMAATVALAQESAPKFKFDQPSDEMDFTLPPVPELPGELPPPPAPGEDNEAEVPGLYGFGAPLPPQEGKEQPEGVIDQFFSTTSIIAPDAEKAEEEEALTEQQPVVEEVKPKPKKRYYRAKTRQKPPHQFKSVSLPQEIYHKNYTRDNKHLPFAYYQDDRQYLFTEALKRDDVHTVRTLYLNGAQLGWSSEDGFPLLTLAVQHQADDVTRWLLTQRVNPDETDGHGLTPLHYAAFSGNHRIVQLLLQHGADRAREDIRGYTPAMYAQRGADSPIVQKMLMF